MDEQKITKEIHKMAAKLLLGGGRGFEKCHNSIYKTAGMFANLVIRPVPMKYWIRDSITVSLLETQVLA